MLLAKRKDRDRLLTLLERVLADTRVQRIQPSAEQTAMLARIRRALDWAGRGQGGEQVGTAREDLNGKKRDRKPASEHI